jgi:hypothetical protein
MAGSDPATCLLAGRGGDDDLWHNLVLIHV